MKKLLLFSALSFLFNLSMAQNMGTLLVINKADNSVSIINLNQNKEITAITTGNGPDGLYFSSVNL